MPKRVLHAPHTDLGMLQGDYEKAKRVRNNKRQLETRATHARVQSESDFDRAERALNNGMRSVLDGNRSA